MTDGSDFRLRATRTRVARVLSGLLVTAALAGMAASPAAAEIVVTHSKGQTTLPATPKTVLVYDLASLDTLDTLGVAVAGVPGGPKPPALAKYNDARFRKVGTLFEPDYEAVNAANPDLVIVGGRSTTKYDAVAKVAPTIDLTTDGADLMGSVKRNVTTLARIFDKTTDAEARLARLQTSVDAVREKGKAAGTALLVLTTGGRMSAYGPGSRFGLLHDVLGLRPAAPDLKVGVHGQPVSFEFIAKTDPDWLFVIDRDAAIGQAGQSARQFLDNDLVKGTKAATRNRIVYLDAANWYLVGGGLSAMQNTVDGVGAALDGARP